MKNRSNALFLLHLPPPVHGSSVVGQSIKDSSVINTEFNCRYINLLASRQVNETGQNSPLKFLRFIKTWFLLFKELIHNKPDFCYFALTTTGTAFYKDVLLVAVVKIFQIKIVYHLHNKGIVRNCSNKINSFLYRFVFKNTNVIILSQFLYNDIEKYVPLSKVQICKNGILDPCYFFDKKDLPYSPVKILFLSNLIESKGVFVIIEACSLLKTKNIQFECLFAGGEGDLSVPELNKKIIELDLNDRVKYIGKKYGQEKEQSFNNADIFVFPTFYSKECFPLVLLEAMSYGLPCVSTKEGGIPDIIEDEVTGFLVPQKDAYVLFEKLELLILNPEMRIEMGKASRKKYEKEFTLEHFENKLVQILKDI